MIVLPLLWQVPKTFHQKFLFPALGHSHIDLDLSVLSVLSVSTCYALKHFFASIQFQTLIPRPSPVEVLLELLLLTRNPSLLVLKIYGKANFLKMLIDVDHNNSRTVLL